MGEREGVGERPGGEERASFVEGVDDGGHGDVTVGKWRSKVGEWKVKMKTKTKTQCFCFVLCVCKEQLDHRLFYSLSGGGWVVG